MLDNILKFLNIYHYQMVNHLLHTADRDAIKFKPETNDFLIIFENAVEMKLRIFTNTNDSVN